MVATAFQKTMTNATSSEVGAFSSFVNLASGAQSYLSHPTWDVVLVFAMLAIGFFYGISTGKKKAVTAMIYTYIAYAVFSAIPIGRFSALIQVKDEFFIRIGAFTVIFIVLLFVFGRGRARGFARPGAWWQIFILSFAQVGLMIHILLSFLPGEKIAALAPLTRTVFANPDLRIWWFLVPLVLLAFLKRTSSFED